MWEGRHKSSLIDTENYLLACYRYIELNPVRAGMVDHPADYPWSSYHVNAGILPRNKRLALHECYQRLGADDAERCQIYRELLSRALDKELIDDIRRAVNFSMPLGSRQFTTQIECALGRKIGHSRRGRPRLLNNND